MKNISRRIWGSGQTVREWASKRGFTYAYVSAIVSGRPVRGVGVGGEILRALVEDGFLTKQEAKVRGLVI